MHYCVLHIVFALIFTQSLRYAQKRDVGVFKVSAVNYVAAAILSAGMLAVTWPNVRLAGQWQAVALGAANGVLYFLTLLALLASYRLAGIGITSAFMAMGVLIPVLVSWCAWSEPMSAFKWAAAALLPAAAILMRPAGGPSPRVTLKGDAALGLVLLASGALGTIHKSFTVYAEPGSRLVYQTVLFMAAAAGTATYARRQAGCYSRRVVTLGFFIGACNVLATLFIVLSLSVVPAVIVYPITSSLVIGLSVIVSWLLWRERVTKRQILGLFTALCIVVLANL